MPRVCPLCEECSYWKLSDICLYKKVAYLFDHPGTVFYAIFMSFWATTFLELWKRKQAVICWEWDLTNFEEEEQMRPEFESTVKTTRINPVTQKPEPYMPGLVKLKRVVFTNTFVVFMVRLFLFLWFPFFVWKPMS